LLSLILGFLLSVWIIKAGLIVPPVKIEQVGLGEGTRPYFPSKFGLPIQISEIDAVPLLQKNVQDHARNEEVILWLGNSQLFGVNQLQPGQVNSTELLFDSLKNKKFVTAFAIPNANLQEHDVVLQYLYDRFKFHQLIIPVFFDDLRETGLRDDLIRDDIKTKLQLDTPRSELTLSLLHQFEGSGESNGNEETKALNHTAQQKVEHYLSDKLSSHSSIWQNRADIRTNIIYNYLFSFRNTLLSISPDSKRKIIPARYRLNMEAFRQICIFCEKNDIKLLVYIPPIRNDVEQPYFPDEYTHFKEDLSVLRQQFGFSLLNLENIVPAGFWGLKGATTIGSSGLEIDFMHFKAEGHKILSDTILAVINKQTTL